jgi:hypothetical protein
MIFRLFPDKDTFISNRRVSGVPQTGSNYGYAESVQVFKLAGVSGALGASSGSQNGRALLHFSTGALDSFASLGYVPQRQKVYSLHMSSQTTPDPNAESVDVEVLAVSGSWDEGRGADVENLYDKGFCNWEKRSSSNYWSSRGGDHYTTPRVVQHFDDGLEDIDVDVTSFFDVWASGTANDGLLVKLTASVESDSVYDDSFLSFYSRHSRYPDRRPYVSVVWDDTVRDDRSRMRWNRTGSLYLYNIEDGRLTNLVGNPPIVRIADASGTLMTVTASYAGMVGVYSASFALPTGSYSGSVFYDLWGSGSFSYMTGSFRLVSPGGQQAIPSRRYVCRVKNIRTEYDPDEVVRFDVLFRREGFRPSVVQTASLNLTGEVIERCFYAVENDATRQRVVPFGTGSVEYTRLSYDMNGNYFYFPMANLHSGNVYRLLFLVEKDGQRQVIDESIKFRVR